MTGHADEAAGTDIVVPLHSRRQKRVLVVQKMQHLIPAAGLLVGGAQSLAAGAHGLELGLAVAGVITSALLIATLAKSARDLQRSASHHAHGVDWMDIWAAGVLFAEAAEHWHARHRVPGPQLLTAFVTLGLGLMHGRLAARGERRRSLRLTRDHLYVGGRLRFSRTLTVRWNEIAQITVTDRHAEIRTVKGRRKRIDLADLENAPAIREALRAAQRRLAPAPS
jgi:hypothetical protein